mgnify:CR=1 FL=1
MFLFSSEYVFQRESFNLDGFMKSKLAKFYTQGPDSTLKKAGDVIRRPDLASTLDKIASGGSDEFYKGSLANDIIQTVSFQITRN